MHNSRTQAAVAELPHARRSRIATAAAIIALAITFVLAGVTSASAHDKLLESNPADGSTVTATPEQIVLTFNNEVSSLGGQVVIKDGSGTEVVNAGVTTQGTSAVVEIENPLPNDTYSVAWRVVSSDSHPITGEFTFTVDDPTAVATTEPEPTQTPEATPEETSATTETEATETGTSDADTSATDATNSSENDDATGIDFKRLAIYAGLGTLAGIAVVIVNNARAKKARKNDSSTPEK